MPFPPPPLSGITEKFTTVPSIAELPFTFFTVALITADELPSAWMELVSLATEMENGGPAVTVMVAVALLLPQVAVTVAVPAVLLLNVVVAMPPAPIGTLAVAIFPRLLVKVTEPVVAELPDASRQVAVIVAADSPVPVSLASIVRGSATTSMLETNDRTLAAVLPSALTVTVATSASTDRS